MSSAWNGTKRHQRVLRGLAAREQQHAGECGSDSHRCPISTSCSLGFGLQCVGGISAHPVVGWVASCPDSADVGGEAKQQVAVLARCAVGSPGLPRRCLSTYSGFTDSGQRDCILFRAPESCSAEELQSDPWRVGDCVRRVRCGCVIGCGKVRRRLPRSGCLVVRIASALFLSALSCHFIRRPRLALLGRRNSIDTSVQSSSSACSGSLDPAVDSAMA